MEELRKELELMIDKHAEEERKKNIAKLVPKLFIMQAVDRVDAFDISIQSPRGTQWATNKYPRELLPAIRQYKTALIHALREAEWTIKYLTEDGLYPMDKLSIKVNWEKNDDNSIYDTDMPIMRDGQETS